jgi:hypothetical protein
MMKKYLAGLALSLMILPAFALAAPSDIDPNAASNTTCVSLSDNLRYRSRDAGANGGVSAFQDFLQSQGYLSSEPTGYFGLLTLKAAKDFQKANGIEPTGYIGTITRGKISSLTCGTATFQPTPTTSASQVATTLPAGCASTAGYSPTTGIKCDGGTSSTPTITSLSSTSGPVGTEVSIYGVWLSPISSSSATDGFSGVSFGNSDALNNMYNMYKILRVTYASDSLVKFVVPSALFPRMSVNSSKNVEPGSYLVAIVLDNQNGYVGVSNSVNFTVTTGSVVVGNGVTVAAGIQPANTLAFNNATRLPFTVVKFTASSDKDVNVSSLTVERTGLANDAAFSGVVLVDESGTQLGVATLNSTHQAILSGGFIVRAGQTRTMTIAANRGTTVGCAGQVASFSLVSVAANATVNGTLPIVGASHTINESLVSPPTITYLSPTSGPAGTPVVISGSGFSATNNIVYFGTGYLPFALPSADGKTINFTVPSTLQPPMPPCPTGMYCTLAMPAPVPVTAGIYPVRVGTPVGGANFTVVSSITPTPITATITSTSAKAAGNFEMDAGGTATISGTYFFGVGKGGMPAVPQVFIGGIQAVVTSASETLVGITVPSSLTAGQSYDLYLSGIYGRSNIVSIKILSTVAPAPIPTISAYPTSVASGGLSVITWSCSNSTNGVIAYGNSSGSGDFASGLSGSKSTGALTVPTTYTVNCTGTGGATAYKQVPVTINAIIVAPPTITSISPNQGTAGTSVTIYGTNLSGVDGVEFYNSSSGVASLTPSSVSATNVVFMISGTFAANVAPGTYQISVVTNTCAGGCNSNQIGFTLNTPVSNAPTITSISPNRGTIGTSVTIYGTNLSGASGVEFYNSSGRFASLTPSSVSATKVVFTIDGRFAADVAPGTYQISVVTNACAGGCNSNRIGFTLNTPVSNAPTVTFIADTTYTPPGQYDLKWNFTGSTSSASYCLLSGNTSKQMISGSYRTPVLTTTTSYGITCYDGIGGTATRSITVSPAPTAFLDRAVNTAATFWSWVW